MAKGNSPAELLAELDQCLEVIDAMEVQQLVNAALDVRSTCRIARVVSAQLQERLGSVKQK